MAAPAARRLSYPPGLGLSPSEPPCACRWRAPRGQRRVAADAASASSPDRRSPYFVAAFALTCHRAAARNRALYGRRWASTRRNGSPRLLKRKMRAPTSTNVAQTLSIKAGTAKRFSVSRVIAGLSPGARSRS